MKIYVVTNGEYSDYRIERVFLTKESAEKYIKVICRDCYDSPDIEEYETADEAFPNEEMFVKCNAMFAHVIDTLIDAHVCRDACSAKNVTEDSVDFIDNRGVKYFYFYVSESSKALRDKELLKKIACDRYAAYKARKEGIA